MIEQRRQIASRIARKATMLGEYFLQTRPELGEVVLLTEGRLGRRTGLSPVGYWLPMSKQAYGDDRARESFIVKARRGLLKEIARKLTENPNIAGPKGKLPA